MQLGLRSADDETGGKSGGFGRMKMEEPRGLLDGDRLFDLAGTAGRNCSHQMWVWQGIITTQNIGVRIFLCWEFS